MQFGQLPYDVAHALGGAMLLCAFALLGQRRLEAMVTVLAVQGALLGLAALWQGWVQGAPQLYLTGVIAIAAKGVAIPVVLHRLLRAAPPAARTEAAPVAASLALAFALVALALLVALPITAGARALLRMDLAVALSLVLLALLLMGTRRLALSQVAGLMALENGVVLAAVGVAGMPFVLEISTAGLVLTMALLAGVLARGMQGQDTALLDPHRGR
ncbi:hydrogenase-4 component E [Roseococcus sp. DSY-14]|uniref:hydrogenase-4 component E n=1 Tax=Roseococcus sp. DSY-14 TaxID=3369650 RepID=UPI00387AC5E6